MADIDILGGNQNGISILKDPFTKGCVESVWLHCYRVRYGNSGSVTYTAKVSFENGDTKGEQVIKGEDMDDLLRKTKAFIESLSK